MKKIILILAASVLFFNFWCLKKKDQTPPVTEIQSDIVIPAPMPQDSTEESLPAIQSWDNQEQVFSGEASNLDEPAVIETSWSISTDAWLTWESKEAVDEIEKELEQIFKELQDE